MYRLTVYGDHDPLMVFEFDTIQEAQEARDMIWTDIDWDEEDENE